MLVMSLIAAIAFVLNRDNGMNNAMVSVQMDGDRARLAAEAGLQAANAVVQSKGCSGGFPLTGTPVTNNNFGGATYSAYATSGGGNTTGLVSTGTFNGTSVTLTRSNVYVYQAAPVAYTLQPNAALGMDTSIDSSAEKNYGADNALPIKKNQQNLLFKFDLSAFPAGSRPLSATFSTYASGGLLGGVDYYRMASAWTEGTGSNSPLDGATWNTSNGSTAWTPGGDNHPAKLNAINKVYGTGWVDFDATDITAAWLSGRYPNYGVVVKSSGELGTFKFTSSDDSNAANRPKISFNYLLPCGTSGPVDAPSGTATLAAIGDTFDDSGLPQANNGAATTLKVYKSASRENRISMSFDTSGIPVGAKVKSATLRLYVNNVASATSNTKSVWVSPLNEAWTEGAGNNTSKVCPLTPTAGSSWNVSNNCNAWGFVHPPNTQPAWTTMAPMPTARTGLIYATVNNRIYAIGGANGSTTLKTVEEYDPATNTWANKAPMPTARAYMAAAAINGKIYVVGGSTNGSTTLKTNEVYDPATNTWASKAAMTTARMGLGAAAANNKLYALGGTTTSSALKNNEEYDPGTNAWTTKKQMTTARIWLSTETVDGIVYAMGGYNGTRSLSANEAYDPVANSWTSKAALPVATDSMGSAVIGSTIYLLGGIQSIFLTNSIRAYDTTNNAYSSEINYPSSASGMAAAALGNLIYSAGGDNGSVVSPNHYQYDPGNPIPLAVAADEATSTSPLPSNFNGGWITLDIKALAQEWIDGIRPNNGLVIYTDVSDQFNINSRENNTKNPQLIVTY